MPPVDSAVCLKVSVDKAARPLRAFVHEVNLHTETPRNERADNLRNTFLRIEHEHTARQRRGSVQCHRHKREANGPSQHSSSIH